MCGFTICAGVRVLLLQQTRILLSYCYSEFKCLHGDRLRKLNWISGPFSMLFFFFFYPILENNKNN